MRNNNPTTQSIDLIKIVTLVQAYLSVHNPYKMLLFLTYLRGKRSEIVFGCTSFSLFVVCLTRLAGLVGVILVIVSNY